MNTITPLPHHDTLREVSHALHEARKGEATSEQANTLVEGSGLSRFLRTVGATLIVLAAITFLAQKWADYTHIQRYFAFLGFTLTLGAAGFISGMKLHDDKGARTFLMIVAAVVPIHFCLLGALLYSRVIAHIGTSISYSPYVLWQANTDFGALATAGVGIALLIPITYLAFSVLLRSRAYALTWVYLCSNALLLIPTREVNTMAALIGGLLIAVSRYDITRIQGMHEARTLEGRCVRAFLFLPLLALLGRTLQLYFLDISALFSSILFAAIAYQCFVVFPSYCTSPRKKSAWQLASILPACIAWECIIKEIFGSYVLNSSLQLLSTGIPLAVLCMSLSFIAQRDVRATFKNLGVVLGVVSTGMNLLVFSSTIGSILSIIVGLTLSVYGYGVKRPFYCLGGFSLLIGGLSQHIRIALTICEMYPWISLGVVGTLIILLSSYVEKNRELFLKFVRSFTEHGQRDNCGK